MHPTLNHATGGIPINPTDINWTANTVTAPGIPGPIQVQIPDHNIPRDQTITKAWITNPRTGQWVLNIETTTTP